MILKLLLNTPLIWMIFIKNIEEGKEINQNKSMNNHKKVCGVLNYIDLLLIVVSTIA